MFLSIILIYFKVKLWAPLNWMQRWECHGLNNLESSFYKLKKKNFGVHIFIPRAVDFDDILNDTHRIFTQLYH